MYPNEPRVACGDRLSKESVILQWIDVIFRNFPASRSRTIFGRFVPAGPNTQVLPWEMKTPGRSRSFSGTLKAAMAADDYYCYLAELPGRRSLVIRVTSSTAAETGTWYDIYAGLTTIWSICGAKGRGGMARIGNFPTRGIYQD